jgi:ribosomal protein S27E
MIHYFAAGVEAARKVLERECPACHHKQVVAISRREESVPCEKCGKPVPPKKPKD